LAAAFFAASNYVLGIEALASPPAFVFPLFVQLRGADLLNEKEGLHRGWRDQRHW
jgi:hypothetical protein